MAENDAEAVLEPPAPKLSIVQLIIFVVLAAASQIGVSFLMDIIKPPPPAAMAEGAEGEEAQPEKLEPANYLPLDPALVVNFQHDGESHFLQASVQLMTRNVEVYEAAKTHSPAIRSALIMLFSNLEFDSANTAEGKEALQTQAKEVTEGVIKDLAGLEGVDAVYLTSFVIQ